MSSNTKAAAGVLLVFILGCAAGGLCSSVYFTHRATVFLQRGAPAYVELLERRATRRLDLDAAQKEQVHQLFMENLEERKKLQVRIQPDIQALNLRTIERIRSILRPEQVEAFHRNLAEFRRRFERAALNARETEPVSASPASSTNSAPEQPNP